MNITIRPLEEKDLPAADRIFRLAFGTAFALPDPLSFSGDAAQVRTRWQKDRSAALAAEVDGVLVGSNCVANWGSFGSFGPLSVRPDFWDRGVAKRLLEPTMEIFSGWGIAQAGIYTHAASPKHLGLYQKFGFWPRFLTAIMTLPVRQPPLSMRPALYSHATGGKQEEILNQCREVTDSLFEGLDLAREIRHVADHGLGDTVLMEENGRVAGFAVCHCGPGTEAGSDTCYVKFGAVRPGLGSEGRFERLLDACEGFASSQGLSHLVAGVNTARHEAYRKLLARGFRTSIQGVAMHRPNEPAFNLPEVYVLDDWR